MKPCIYHDLIRLTPLLTLSELPCSPIIQKLTVHYVILSSDVHRNTYMNLYAYKYIHLYICSEKENKIALMGLSEESMERECSRVKKYWSIPSVYGDVYFVFQISSKIIALVLDS
jgi:hypothetical protein